MTLKIQASPKKGTNQMSKLKSQNSIDEAKQSQAMNGKYEMLKPHLIGQIQWKRSFN
jgi:hypothetical protein